MYMDIIYSMCTYIYIYIHMCMYRDNTYTYICCGRNDSTWKSPSFNLAPKIEESTQNKKDLTIPRVGKTKTTKMEHPTNQAERSV